MNATEKYVKQLEKTVELFKQMIELQEERIQMFKKHIKSLTELYERPMQSQDM